MLFEDESMIRDYQAIQKTRFLRGKQRIIPTTGSIGVKLLATVDYETGYTFGKKMNSTPLKRFFPSKGHGDLSNRETGSGFGQCPDSSCARRKPFYRFWKRKKIGLSLCTCLHTAPS
ncbi:hypothetical protein P7H06_14015 [Paenibacillus larvae]|nr:hypothetical protein [Paenibacillus larvae]MDT2260402.1 hypothetical protein [Paenibacillus larvae]